MIDTLSKTRISRVSNRSFDESGGGSDEIRKLRDEISEVYKKKSKNDQELIDANRRLAECERNLNAITEERDKLKSDLDKMCARIAQQELLVKQTLDDNQNMRDEMIALKTTCDALTRRKMEWEEERIALLNKIRELNEKYAEFFNREVDDQEERRRMKIQEEITKAIQDTSRDERTNSLLQQQENIPIGDVLLGDVVPSQALAKFDSNDGEVNDVLWLSGETFASAGSDRRIRIWRIDSQGRYQKLCSLSGANQAVTRLDYDKDKHVLLGSSNDNMCRLWNVDNQRLLTTLSGHTDKVSCARYHQSHNIVSGSYDRCIKLWDIHNQRCTKSYFPGSIVLDIIGRQSLGGAAFISAHFDKKIRFWDGRNSEPFKIVEMSGKVTSLALSEDGLQLLASTRDDTLSLIDIRNYHILHIYSAEQYRTSGDLARCVISPGQDYVAAGSADGHVYVWNSQTTRLEKILARGGHESAVLCLSWCPTGVGLLSGDKIRRVCYWH
ncbi:hypothetical protein WR25_11682 isoform F [Diploscapter pachys]|nr:hypothetical protein WR25_11682 isoform F [Diploscapter pachys]